MSNPIILILILILYLIIGIFPSKKFNRESFLISNRNLGGWRNGFSIAASKIGGGLLVAYSTLFFAFGISAFWIFIGFIVGYIIFYFFAKKLLSNSNSKERNKRYYTLADFFADKYSKSVGWWIGILTTVSVFGWVLTNLVAGSHLIAQLSGQSIFLTISILSLVIGAYTYIGGFNSVVRTDAIQYIALLVIFFIFSLVIFNNQPTIFQDVQHTNIDLFNLPIGKIIGFLLLGILFPLGSAELWQRVYASKNKKELKKALGFAGVSYILLGFFISLVSFVILENNAIPIDIKKDELKLFYGLRELIPIALVPIWIVAYLSAIISSADTFIYTTASSIVQDLMLKKKIIKKHQVIKYIRLTIILLLITSVIIGLIFSNVVGITFVFVGFTLVISGITLISWLSKKSIPNELITFLSVLGGLSILAHVLVKGKATILTALIGFLIVVFSFIGYKLFVILRVLCIRYFKSFMKN